MLSRYLNLPLGIVGAILAALAFNLDNGYYAIGAVICGIGMIALYFFSDAIDWEWYKKNPPTIDDEMRNRLSERLPYYQSLSEVEKAKFEERIELYIRANEFIPNGWERVPYDIKAWVAVNPVMLTFHQEDFLMSMFERVVIYPHSFPSPQYPENFHCSEVFQEDGVLLFSAEKLLPGVMQPKAYFNIGIYEYAKVYKLMNPVKDYPEMSNLDWLAFERIVNYTKTKLENYIGLKDLDHWGILCALFFSHPGKMNELMPQHYLTVKGILNY